MAKAEVAALRAFFALPMPVVQVAVTKVQGSAPRETDARMFVSQSGQIGTIGGGQLEYLAIREARALLERGADHGELDVPLGPEIGQCCGGRVQLALQLLSEKEKAATLLSAQADLDKQPSVYLFGAGHVGRALANSFNLLPLNVSLIDGRRDELAQCSAPVARLATALPEEVVRQAKPASAFVVATHDHGLDFVLAAAALARGDAAYVGLIGSATKRAKFQSYCRTAGIDLSTDPLVCPIGQEGLGDKRPEVIAAFVAAEVMAVLNAVEASR